MTEGRRVALVTGGGRGIGKGIALRLAKSGIDVAITYTRGEAEAEQTAKELKDLGVSGLAIQGAVQSYDDNKRVVETVIDTFGQIDILVNNAGIASKGRSVVDTDPAEVERLLAIHAIGPHMLSGLIVAHMKSRPRGDIVFVSSIAVLHNMPMGAPYNMAKAAEEALALTLAKEVRRVGIHVNIVRPGLVDTDMGRRLVKATQGVSDINELDASMPFGRVCIPEDVGNAVAHLVSDEASYLSGQTIEVSGGQEWH